MQASAHPTTRHELFSASEIATAAGVPPAAVRALIDAGHVVAFRGYVAPADAARLVRQLRRGELRAADRSPLTTLHLAGARRAGPVAASALMHAAGLVLLIWAGAVGLFATDTSQHVFEPQAARLVFLIDPGPGGGGGGGGLQMPAPPPQAKREAPPRRPLMSSPIVRVRRDPPVRSTARLVRPAEPPRVVPKPIDVPAPPPAQVVQAPVAQAPADPVSTPGLLAAKTTVNSSGPGIAGGVGFGAGTGLGEGRGSGIGEGEGGGAGGGLYGPGSGVEPPAVLREVRPTYSDEARRRGLEGNVGLQVVVLRDGSVGNVRVVKSLGAGLDQKAIDAVRQWRFRPASRKGVPVDVTVDVAVEFKLR
ncbi:MAG: energy transducer TonB [Acidobacteria bacterium]|nr:energy transducer TonB [Acidobacteriota bacterium]